AALSTAAAHPEAAVRSAPRPWWALPPVLYPVKVAALLGLYYGSAKLGYTVGFSGPVAAIVWLPVGVAVSGLSLFGLALRPGAVVGPISLALAGVVKADSLFEVSRTWWLGDLCGALVVVPVAIAWWPPPRRRPALDRHLVEGVLLLVVVATLAETAAHSHQPVA